jgi:carboxypeptidase C (cathepsin A)
VAYTVANADAAKRPVIFFYNGGPGSASTYLHLGSFGPRRLVSTIPQASIPPVQLVDNQETLLASADRCSSTPSAPATRKPLPPTPTPTSGAWTKDAAAFRDFVRRYVAVNKREASPKFLFGESYGAPRTAVLANLLETAGVQIDGLVLLGHHGLQQQLRRARSQRHQLRGYIPTYALTSAYHGRAASVPVDSVRSFAAGGYRTAIAAYLASNGTAGRRAGQLSDRPA